ncbi:hypothetical protein JRO89_XS12G0241600 [Xanthoceras sorbifolium]|uniref:Uncharacterized protein n=1 Tax=Xanthoceras sorbifolium TaxID=99658 RepID=A0ABQ8HDM5_9ROSI|nr:hypothetical protein JRO89_XS12G0241600 [Xanthoceras sorbifolium]
MGRPPCCDKVGVKKGPWTPEEDIILVSYIQEHGPGNWRAVPTNTGSLILFIYFSLLLFDLFIDLEAVEFDDLILTQLQDGLSSASHNESISRGQWERRLQTDIHLAKQALCEALSPEKPSFLASASTTTTTTTYASSTENIAKLLKGWVRNSPKSASSNSAVTQHSFNNNFAGGATESASSEETPISIKPENSYNNNNGMELPEAFESLFGLESFDSSNSELSQSMSPDESCSFFQDHHYHSSIKQDPTSQMSLLENWLFDDQQGKDYNLISDLKLDENTGIF